MPILPGQIATSNALNALPTVLDSLAFGSVSNTVTETIIGTFANGIPATDASVNSGYQFVVSGTRDSSGTPTIRFRLYMNAIATGNRIYDSGTLTGSGTATGSSFWIWAFITCTAAGASGTFDGGGNGHISNVSAVQPTSSAFSAQNINTTVPNIIIFTAQWGTASASNTARTTSGVMRRT